MPNPNIEHPSYGAVIAHELYEQVKDRLVADFGEGPSADIGARVRFESVSVWRVRGEAMRCMRNMLLYRAIY